LRQRGFYGATVDFLVLKSTGMIATNVRDFRQSALKRNNLYLTARPYTVPELEALLEAVKSLKREGFPRSQLHRLREQLEKGWLASIVEYLYLQARLRRAEEVGKARAEEVRKALDGVWVGLQDRGRPGSIGPWMRRESDNGEDHEFETVLGDLVEIYDFVPEGGREDAG